MAGSALQHSFSGHETFPFRYPWLKKGFDAVREDGNVFLRDNAITTLGVGKNMFLCGYFGADYLGYEAAEGLDWVWEHRIEDLLKLWL